MLTVLNDELIGWDQFNDGLLWGYKDHKAYEAKLLLSLPLNYSFLDVGAHYGDTILTMALHAKNNNRSDIRFFAFEPNSTKCDYIQRIAKLNNLNIIVFNFCVGNKFGKASNDGINPENLGCTSFQLDNNGNINILTLDSIKNIIMPVGVIHIDTEGWEAAVLEGSSELFKNSTNTMYVIAECWPDDVAAAQIVRGRGGGIATSTPEMDIINEMSKHPNSTRLDNINDGEINLVFKLN
jgi:FkbM family methyltransferase